MTKAELVKENAYLKKKIKALKSKAPSIEITYSNLPDDVALRIAKLHYLLNVKT